MLSIFGKYDEDAWATVYSLAMSDISNLNLSLEDDGFLPDDVTSPYEMLLRFGRNVPKNPLNINNLSLPLSYEVEFLDDVCACCFQQFDMSIGCFIHLLDLEQVC